MFKGKIVKYVDAYSLNEVVEQLNITKEDVLGFLKIRNYIMQLGDEWYATVLGLEKGCVVNSTSEDVIGITKDGFERIKMAFTPEFTQKEQNQLDAIISYINKGGCK